MGTDNTDLARLAVALRLRRSELEAQKKTELAVRYQLLTDSTSFLLTAQREDGQRTDGMPALHKVRPMVAAGWGGLGTVQCLSIPKGIDHAMPGSAAFSEIHWSAEPSAFAPFDDIAGLFTESRSASSRAARVEATSLSPQTPLQIRRWLRTHRPDEWPTTIAGLGRLGIPEQVLTWLQDELARQQDTLVSEDDLVGELLQAVLNLFSSAPTAVKPGGTIPTAIKARISSVLQTISPQEWPKTFTRAE